MTTPPLKSHPVYDPLLRLMHATLGLSVLGLAATGWGHDLLDTGTAAREAVWEVHFLLGKVLAVTLALRAAWGVVGPVHARWRDLWHPVAWIGLMHARWPARRLGHDVMASGAYLALYAVLGLMVASGLALQSVEHGTGPLGAWLLDRENLGGWLEEPHEVGAALTVGFVVLHLVAMRWHSLRERRPVMRAMWNGNQYQPRTEV